MRDDMPEFFLPSPGHEEQVRGISPDLTLLAARNPSAGLVGGPVLTRAHSSKRRRFRRQHRAADVEPDHDDPTMARIRAVPPLAQAPL